MCTYNRESTLEFIFIKSTLKAPSITFSNQVYVTLQVDPDHYCRLRVIKTMVNLVQSYLLKLLWPILVLSFI